MADRQFRAIRAIHAIPSSAIARFVSAFALAAALVFGTIAAPSQERPSAAPSVTTASAVPMPSLSPLIEQVLPAVVNVAAVQKPGTAEDLSGRDGGTAPSLGGSPLEEFLRKFFEQFPQAQPNEPEAKRIALGSGFIIDPAGYIVTNNHVVENAAAVTVVLQDDSKYDAKVIGRDDKTDLAVLKIAAPKPLPFERWGDSDAAKVGDWVVAIGDPFGLGGTVSAGIISARGRDLHEGPYDDFLQIDAAINRGNSGGPTFGMDGRVLGINTAIYSPSGGSVGIGFAIPANLAKPLIEELKATGRVARGWLGVQIQEVTPEIAAGLGFDKTGGALVADVTGDSPAAAAGIRRGDIIVTFNGRAIRKVRDLPTAVAAARIGAAAEMMIWRRGRETTLRPTIREMPEKVALTKPEAETPPPPEKVGTLGLAFAPLTAELREQLRLGKDVKGVVVTKVAGRSPFAEIGVQAGDVIEEIDQVPIATVAEAIARLDKAAAKKGTVLLLINRRGTSSYLALSFANQVERRHRG